MIYMMWRFGKPDPRMANGMLAGLVAITAPCAFVTASVSMLIGAISGVLVCLAVFLSGGTLKVDDPSVPFSVHGVSGTWGVLSVGLFADGKYGDGWNGVPGTVTGLFYGATRQFFAQCIGTLTCAAFVFTSFYLFFKGGRGHRQPRSGRRGQIADLDLPEMGALAYRVQVATRRARGALPAPTPMRAGHRARAGKGDHRGSRTGAARRSHGAPP